MNKKKFYGLVYDVLIDLAGAPHAEKENFVYSHIKIDAIVEEWRFGGYLGFGGKYWSEKNSVNCYQENETPKIIKLIEEINKRLDEINHPNK